MRSRFRRRTSSFFLTLVRDADQGKTRDVEAFPTARKKPKSREYSPIEKKKNGKIPSR